MRDPHVRALYYRLVHDDTVDYNSAAPLEYDEDSFSLRLQDGRAIFEMKRHYATEEQARASLNQFIDSWEIMVGLQRGPGEFSLKYESADIIDRNPDPGVISVQSRSLLMAGCDAVLHLSQASYPQPPAHFSVSAEVEAMYKRHLRYRNGGETLSSMAYYCYTALAQGGDQAATEKYFISRNVIERLRILSSRKGGPEGRKWDVHDKPYSGEERAWLEAAVKVLILRAGEIAANPSSRHSQITMSDLPRLP